MSTVSAAEALALHIESLGREAMRTVSVQPEAFDILCSVVAQLVRHGERDQQAQLALIEAISKATGPR